MRLPLIILPFFVFIFLTTKIAFGQEKIFTDRPNVTDAAGLLPKYTFQIEAGYMNQYFKSNGVRSHFITAPNLGFKYGLSQRVELRVLTNYNLLRADDSPNLSGLSPITISPKIKLIDQEFLRPAITLATSLTLPGIGAEEFQTGKVNYGFRFLLEHVFNGRFSWAHSFGADWDDTQEVVWAYSSAFGMSFGDRWGAFTELYGNFATDFPGTHGFDAGITYLVNNDLQFDTSFGLPLSKNAADYFISFGVGWKTNFKND